MKKCIAHYINGNYRVYLFEDGTKIRYSKDPYFKAAFAENIDIKLTDRCTGTNCGFCHEGSGPTGKNGDILNLKFFDTLHSGQEVALGGGNVLEHPDLVELLKRLSTKGVVCNITVNQIHFLKNEQFLKSLIESKLIKGLGVSLVCPTEKLIEALHQSVFENVVVHTINGIVTKQDIEKLKNNGVKLLILGYKTLRRGASYLDSNHNKIAENQTWLKHNIKNLFGFFKVVSFDNLALDQLDMKNQLSEDIWKTYYMGDDGTSTFYIDCVNKKFAKSSTAPLDQRYELLDSVDEMFSKIRG